ncbi:MAG: OmpA family protein [Bacteroidales bacterium]|nr:OmpA family protein [Bacteroidales bacterium]
MLLLLASCGSSSRSQRKAEAALAIGEYATAAQHYKRAYQLTPIKERGERGRLSFLMGECYRRYGYAARALGSYRTAERYKYTDTTTLLRVGQMLLLQGDYRAAERALLAYQASHPSDTMVLASLRSCQLAPQLKETGSLYTVRLAAQLNSNRSDYSPALWGSDKEQQLYFTSNRSAALGDEISGITAQKTCDIFMMKRDEKGRWTAPEPLPEGVNSASDEGTPAFSPDGKTMYFTLCDTHPEYPRMAAIYKSSRADAAWSKAQEVKLSKDTLSSYAHPALSPDGRWLYFTSDMPGGYGGFDLWRADLRAEGGQSVIENLGASINTAGDEKFPYCRADGSLYFSTDGRETMGGLDLYRAVEDSLAHTWNLEHLPAPMNSNADDFGITFEGLHHRGYFSSSRSTSGRGWDKIYEFSHPETLLTAKGWVYEQDGYELPAAVVQIIGSDGTNVKLPVKTDGSFEHKLTPGVDYLYMASCRGFLNFPNRLHADSIEREHQYVLQFPLPSLSIPVLVRNVFYEFDKADLTPESTEALDRLAKLLTENGHITIELAAHTDHRGSDAYNLTLSQRRAESVVRYLTSKGIAPDRLTAKGYGETQPKVVNKKLLETHPFLHQGDTLTTAYIDSLPPLQQDSCHALNRRTEFRVLRTTYGLFDANGRLRPQALPKKKEEAKPSEEDEYEYVEE